MLDRPDHNQQQMTHIHVPTEPPEIEKFKLPETKEHYKNTDPSVWGPKFWFTLHNGALNYPSLANPLCIERMKNFIIGIPVMIPCLKCQEHATSFIEKHKDYLDYICSKRDTLFKFFVDFHNQVNERQGKPLMSYEDAYKLYDQ
jgi:FAD-linked sulfhydryl oxidase